MGILNNLIFLKRILEHLLIRSRKFELLLVERKLFQSPKNSTQNKTKQQWKLWKELLRLNKSY